MGKHITNAQMDRMVNAALDKALRARKPVPLPKVKIKSPFGSVAKKLGTAKATVIRGPSGKILKAK